IEMPFMLVVIILSARWLVNRFVFGGEIRRPIITGGLAAVLLLAVEFGVVLRLREISLEQYLSSRDPIAGGVYYALVAMFGLAPVIVAKLKKAPQDAEPMEVH